MRVGTRNRVMEWRFGSRKSAAGSALRRQVNVAFEEPDGCTRTVPESYEKYGNGESVDENGDPPSRCACFRLRQGYGGQAGAARESGSRVETSRSSTVRVAAIVNRNGRQKGGESGGMANILAWQRGKRRIHSKNGARRAAICSRLIVGHLPLIAQPYRQVRFCFKSIKCTLARE